MKKILIVGSTIIEQWFNVANMAPGCDVINQSIDETMTYFWVSTLPRVIAKYSPQAVLFYCGNYDLDIDTPLQQIVDNILQCRQIVRDHSAETQFACLAILKAPQNESKWDMIDRINNSVRDNLPSGDLYIDTNQAFFQEGQQVEKYFTKDKWRITIDGYTALLQYARPLIGQWLGIEMEAASTPRCMNCLAEVDPLQHYCYECGDPVGQLTPYIPLVNIRWEALIWGRMWKQAVRNHGPHWSVRAFYFLMFIFFVPGILFIIPVLLLARYKQWKQQFKSDQ